ncbi:MAG: hypothetical protein AAGG01_08380, partial [Planctomycetota bacterium]
RRVPEFSHADHMGRALAGGGEVSCVDCHTAPGADGDGAAEAGAAAPGPGLIGTLEAAMDCTLCHDHSPGSASEPTGGPRASLTAGGVTLPEVEACTLCHTGGVPELEATVSYLAAHVYDVADGAFQHHPQGEECTSCHIPRDGLIQTAAASTGSRVFAQRTFYSPPASTQSKPSIHRNDERKLRPGRVQCVACHWTSTVKDSGDEGSPLDNVEKARTRRLWGDSFNGFPGGRPEDFRR